ncbi:glycosyltransferase family 2 protein [Nesterenkonia halotolerans]|uniref:glycosyltransferase family 2 protein n=1 Tax=Nesterenkonia halotolerans TaxID=225325 RepID=UPI003EE5C378
MILETAKFDSNAVVGWCYERAGQSTAAVLILSIDGREIERFVADRPLSEVYPDSTSRRPAGFSALLPAAIRDGVPHHVEIAEVEGKARLAKIVEAPSSRLPEDELLFGEYHGYDGGAVLGWACRLGETVLPDVTIDDQSIRVMDVVDAANSQRAQHGFKAMIPAKFYDGLPHEVAVRVSTGSATHLLGRQTIELPEAQRKLQWWRLPLREEGTITVDSLKVSEGNVALTLAGEVRHRRVELRLGFQQITMTLVSPPASGPGATRALGQYSAKLSRQLPSRSSYNRYEPGDSLRGTYDLRLGDTTGRRPSFLPRTVSISSGDIRGGVDGLLPTLAYWAKIIRENGASRLSWFSTLARETQSIEARDVLALAASGGEHSYASLMEVIELARFRSSDRQLQDSLRTKVWLPALFTLAQVLYSQRLSTQDFGDVYSIYEYADHAFGRQAFTDGVDRSYYADLLTQRRFTAKARQVLDYSETNSDRAYSQRYLEVNSRNPHVSNSGEKTTTEEWLVALNNMFAADGLTEVSMMGDSGPDFFSLNATSATLPGDRDEPLVTVVMPIYEPNAATDVAIRSLLAQSWRNLEIIIVDDASPQVDELGNATPYRKQLEGWAARDRRIKLIFSAENRGAYSVRNEAFGIAKGEFLTIADKDDWHHPQRIELQARQLMENPSRHANIVNWARVNENMMFQVRWGPDRIIHPSFACIMFRRAEVMDRLGFWDAIRKSADNEYRKRFEIVFGQKLKPLIDAPMAFSLLGDDNLTSSDFGLGYRHPDREVYQRSYGYWHEQIQKGTRTPHLAFDAGERSFHSPTSFLPERSRVEKPHFDVVYISEFGMLGGPALSLRREIQTAARAGLKVGFMPLRGGLDSSASKRRLAPELEEAWTSGSVEWVTWNSEVSAGVAIINWPGVMELPPGAPVGLDAAKVVLVASHLPSSIHGAVRNYSVQRVTRNVERIFRVRPMWAAQSPVVEEVLHELLSTTDVLPVRWTSPGSIERPTLRHQSEGRECAVVGRVLDEEERYWPGADVVRDIYPDDTQFEVLLLSRLQQLKKQGVVAQDAAPRNWVILPPEMMSYEDYLSSLDFLVHYSSEPWDPNVDGSVLRAMELGVVCVLHPTFKPVYGEAAVYAAPGDVRELLRGYWDHPESMQAQRERGWAFVEQQRHPTTYLEVIASLSGSATREAKE